MNTQEDLDARVTRLEQQNAVGETQLTTIRAAIDAERAEVKVFVDSHPDLDFTRLDAAQAKTDALLASADTVDEEVATVFEPSPSQPVV